MPMFVQQYIEFEAKQFVVWFSRYLYL